MENCLFCKIANKEAPADIVYEDDKIVAFKDIHPKAPIHLLIVPKKHIPSVDHLELADKELMGELILTAQKIAKKIGVAKSGYKLVFNVGKGGGQLITHLHLHLLAGWKNEKERNIPGMP
jgi:histidine triad (HIT) family protein